MINWVSGHYWTLGPHVSKALRPPEFPASRLISAEVDDDHYGRVRLTGRLSEPPGARDLLVIVHGLGGWCRSKYVFAAAQIGHERGLACLRFNLRGADRLGEDFYHAGLASDLGQMLARPELAHFERIFIVGYSIGGHVTLRYAADGADPRVRAVAALCAPLDLDRSAYEIDRFSRAGYRRYVLSGMMEMFTALAARREIPVTVQEARAIRSLREWDNRIIAPRYGFRNAEDYYHRASVGSHLHRIQLPTLIVAARHDPMILAHTLVPSLSRTSSAIHVEWVNRGGHVGFPPDTNLGLPVARGLESQVVEWLQRRS